MENTMWVVTSNSWNGEHDVVSVVGVFDDATSKRVVEDGNANRHSSYSTSYEREEFTFNEVAR